MADSSQIVPSEVFDLQRLRLRRPVLSDAEALFECTGDREVVRYMDWPVVTSLDQITDRMRQREHEWASGKEYYWVITLRNVDCAIGGTSCRFAGDSADFGYLIGRRYWRNGYATEAARAIVDWVISLPTIRRVWATCDFENLASERVLQKVGLSRESILPQVIVRPNLSNEPRDAIVYSWTRCCRRIAGGAYR